MPDQAAGLRSLFARRRPSLVIVGGNDAGKAAVATQVARDAAAAGRATVLVDGTAGQVAAACGTACRYELSHVLAGDVPLVDALRTIEPHLLLLPAARAIAHAADFTDEDEARLAAAFAEGIPQALVACGADDTQIDLIVVHAAEGQAKRAVEVFGRDARVVIAVSERPASLRGAYAELKSLVQLGLENFEIVQPCPDAASAGSVAFKNLADAARRFLDIELVDGGAMLLPHADGEAACASAPRPVAQKNIPATSSSDDEASSNDTSSAEVHHAAVA